MSGFFVCKCELYLRKQRPGKEWIPAFAEMTNSGEWVIKVEVRGGDDAAASNGSRYQETTSYGGARDSMDSLTSSREAFGGKRSMGRSMPSLM